MGYKSDENVGPCGNDHNRQTFPATSKYKLSRADRDSYPTRRKAYVEFLV